MGVAPFVAVSSEPIRWGDRRELNPQQPGPQPGALARLSYGHHMCQGRGEGYYIPAADVINGNRSRNRGCGDDGSSGGRAGGDTAHD